MKSLGGELTSLAVTLAIPAAVVCVFPYGAAEFRAADPAATADPAAAFLTLSPEEESAATHAAKASWQGSREGAQNIRADLSFGELPKAREPEVLDVGSRTRLPPPANMAWQAPPLLPRMAAPPPPQIAPEPPEPDKPPFPRDEMLRIDGFGLGTR